MSQPLMMTTQMTRGYLCPVKSNQTHSHPMNISEHLVHCIIVRSNPTDPCEVAESLKEISREDVPDGTGNESEEEEFFTADTSSAPHPGIMLLV
jgi:hypothetical protein